ncbi:DNA cytosine methyltransferase [Comamonas aquatica]|uniref:DNA cytosine methyltransferase n=1 Tax=Comamonas aquatica TaxID=225991 RepID=UPI00244803B4|nr:DNA cytosine methyltransferase [Comamonas aquatica]MDH1766548.1 DNA cytosine methyltransferase [Comamonas aquatica]
MKRDNFTLGLDLGRELIIDNFAGGGGTSTGLEMAFGRPVDIAINHNPEALAMHALNHPHTLHLCESVWEVDPIAVTKNQPVGLVWLSPDCKHFSKAKGGTPVEKHIRGLAWVGMRWAAKCKPRMLMLENVEEFQDWGPLIVDAEGKARPDPARKGQTFKSFVRQLRGLGYAVDWTELRACDHDTPTIRKRLFLVARRDGLPIVFPEPTHAEPTDRRVLAGKLAPQRTAAECIDFDLPAESVFGRKRPLVTNTMRRVAKGLYRHVLASASPFIVDVQSKGIAAPVVATMRGTHESQLGGHSMRDPLGTVTAGGIHHGVAMAHITKFNTGSVGSAMDAPLPTVTAGGTPKRPSTGIQMGVVAANLVTIGYGERAGQQPRVHSMDQPLGTVVSGGVKSALVAAHLVDMGHGEGPAGGKRFSHGVRSLEVPLNTVTASGATSALAAVHLTHLTHHGERSGTSAAEPMRTVTGAHRGEMALVAACLEQANGGFYEGDGRAADAPMSTVTASGTQQRLITAYLVKYYSEGGQDSACNAPMHTVPTKARMGLVQTVKVPADALDPEHAQRARLCAELLHQHLPEQFPDPATLVLMRHAGQLWALVDITLRMLKPRELYRAQGFPEHYQIEEIPDPALLFIDGKQAPGNPLDLPRIALSTTAQVRMVGNSVPPPVAAALVRANFRHEALLYAA